MASGDVVGNYYATTTTFQPAAGVSIGIFSILSINSSGRIVGLGNIDTSGSTFQFGTGAGTNDNVVAKWQLSGYKFLINNSQYLQFVNGSGFSGIQLS